jgi:hypothetical protein
MRSAAAAPKSQQQQQLLEEAERRLERAIAAAAPVRARKAAEEASRLDGVKEKLLAALKAAGGDLPKAAAEGTAAEGWVVELVERSNGRALVAHDHFLPPPGLTSRPHSVVVVEWEGSQYGKQGFLAKVREHRELMRKVVVGVDDKGVVTTRDLWGVQALTAAQLEVSQLRKELAAAARSERDDRKKRKLLAAAAAAADEWHVAHVGNRNLGFKHAVHTKGVLRRVEGIIQYI